ncbi:hypothetical protein P3T23_009439 [Paraburkholderia sp. GAS448]|uniref:hypothetical protein n=1 Tax=Paraburkholderia sp. GAS448 TaxID=3035136 RepID=UPI003D201F89
MYSTFSQTAPHSLPVSSQALELNFLRFSIQEPPFVPRVEIESWMVGYVRIVAGLSANVIQEQAQSNPLRTFFFNLFAQNNFANDKFAALVQGILDYIVITIGSQPGIPVEEILESSVRNMIELVTASMTKLYPQLRTCLDTRGEEDVNYLVREFERITVAIDQFRRQFGYQYVPAGQSGNRAPGNDRMAVPPSRPGSGGYPDIYPALDRRPVPVGYPARYDGVHEASAQLFGGAQSPQSIVPRSGEIFSSRFSNLSDASTSRYARVNGSTSQGNSTMNAVIEEKPAKDGPLEDANNTRLVWFPFRDQLYHPIYDPDAHQLFYQKLAGDDVLAVLRSRGDDMDYDRHRTKSVFGPVPPGLDLDDRERVADRLQQGLKEIREERQAREEEVVPEVCTHVKEAVIEESSLEAVWLQAAVEWQASAEGGRRPGIFRVYGDVYDIAVGDEDESGFVESLRSAGTFRNLRSILDDRYGVVSDSLWYKANERATRLVNRVLALNLGLRQTTIDSFTGDLEALLQALRHSWGAAMVEALERHQRALIAAMYRETPESNQVFIADSLCDAWPQGLDRPKLTFMSSWSSLTFVNCTSHELAVEWGKDTTALVTKHAVPLFYQIVRDIVEEARNLGHNLEHYLLQTSDGKMIEIGTAFLADDEGYVVRLTN